MAKPDWEAIESAYRAGVLSLRDIGDKYGVTEGAIRKRAKKFDWVRNSGTQVRKMVRKVVRKRVRRVPAKSLPALAARKKVRNQKPSLHQIRNRYAGCVPIRRPTHSNPATSRR